MSHAEKQIYAIIGSLLEVPAAVAEDTPLLGAGSVLDSMKLVELCVTLEDLASEWGFEFDWTSDAAMSKARSMFRTAGTLAGEFLSQMDSRK